MNVRRAWVFESAVLEGHAQQIADAIAALAVKPPIAEPPGVQHEDAKAHAAEQLGNDIDGDPPAE
jgi:hypothetical protein